jgi:hypothetical protein
MITWHRLVAAACFLSLLSLVVLLAGCAAVQSAPTKPIGTSTPSRDPATQAYLSVLQQYYAPFSVASHEEITACSDTFEKGTAAQLQHQLAPCRPVEMTTIAATQAVLDHLAMVSPPARWQTADHELKQALQAGIAFLAAKIHAIDDQSVSEYLAAENNQGVQAGKLFCDPIAQFNAGPPPLSPPLLPPVLGLCQSTD